MLSPSKNIDCPNCGKSLDLKKTTGRNGQVIEDAETGQFFETVHRHFRCQSCSYSAKSVEWRPLPTNSCCAGALSNSRVNTAYIKNVGGDLVWERQRSVICVCGKNYLWVERMLMGKAEK